MVPSYSGVSVGTQVQERCNSKHYLAKIQEKSQKQMCVPHLRTKLKYIFVVVFRYTLTKGRRVDRLI